MLFSLQVVISILSFFKFVLGGGVDLSPDSTHSCRVPEGSTFIDGFRARFYPYLHPQYTYEYDNHDYLLNLYSTLNQPLTTIYGINDVNYVYTGPNAYNGPQWGLLHGFNVTLTNFTIEYVGYFIPQKTGSYTFSFDNTDDSALLFFANPSAFRCCNADADITIDQEDVSIDAIDQWATGAPSTVTHVLEEGIAYPMRIVYYNQGGIGKLHMTWKDPDGVTHETFDDYVTFFTDLETECAHEIVTQTTSFEPGTATETTTYTTLVSTFTGEDDVVTTETIYVVQTPDTRTHTATATTIYTEGTDSITATYSTGTGIYTGTDGIVTTETTYYVEKPGPETTITTALTKTIYSSDAIPTTETEVVTYTTTDDDGDEEIVIETDIQEIMVPTIGITFDLLKTTTQYLSIYTPTIATHVTTYTSTDDEGDEEEVVETDVEVELPSVDKTTTIVKTTTEFGSVTVPTTVTHVTTYFTTDDEGDEEEVVETDIEVELPSIAETITTASTVLTEGQVTETITIATIITTYYTTDAEGEEEEVVETDYIVEIPDVYETLKTATTKYINYSGSVSTTLTHITTCFTTDANGNEEEVIETEIIVEIPEQSESVIDAEDSKLLTTSEEIEIVSSTTIFSYYTGSVTSTYSTQVRTYTTTGTNGKEEIVETDYYVEIPKTASVLATTEERGTSVIEENTTAADVTIQFSTSTSSVIPKQFIQPTASSSNDLSEYTGSGSSPSCNILSYCIGLLTAILYLM
ncbi:similar to Tetrapisispora phaffii TPHA_0P00110 hypothetical protein [Maudiozyma saulgeensis]|uniref:PA14 domain-containing protein n=1 Tax=Maudiozyma saulgeensis TaxID=1789683 RepID=A0A1X7R9Z7_9SACH|nr:similar to Tetrapisispora phaffii TPHA_0P00110 hypothetical protein [Kazachstania saulgeensis]